MEIYKVNDWTVTDAGDRYIIENTTHPDWYNEYLKSRKVYRYRRKRVPKRIDMFIKAQRNTEARTFGVEIECYHPTNPNIRRDIAERLTALGIPASEQHYNHNTQTCWKIITDSSISGGTCAEVVSPILRGNEGREQLRKVMKAISELGCRVNRTTGMHTHIGADDLTETELHRVFELYEKNESLMDKLVARSRREGNTYCQSLRGYTGTFPTTRYTKVNYQSYLKYGTIEFRQHQGTLNGDKATHWVDLVEAIVNRATDTTPIRTYGTLEEMLNDLGIEETNWYLERAEELAA